MAICSGCGAEFPPVALVAGKCRDCHWRRPPEPPRGLVARYWWSGAFAVGAAAIWYFVQMGPVTAADKARYEPECERWISEEFGEGQRSRVVGSWKKRGMPVFEVFTPRGEGTSGSLHLCVVDKTRGVMTKPSAFDRSWR